MSKKTMGSSIPQVNSILQNAGSMLSPKAPAAGPMGKPQVAAIAEKEQNAASPAQPNMMTGRRTQPHFSVPVIAKKLSGIA
jgi:hypothetical protein